MPTQCLSISSPDHLYLAGRQFIATHNTDSRADVYVETFGDQSWELDALDPATLAGIVEGAVLGLRDERRWEDAVRRERRGRELLAKVSGDWEGVVRWLG